MAGIQHQLSTGAVPNQILNVCPPGTKFHLLETGWLECDEGYVIRSANSSLKSTEHNSFINKRRKLISYCVLIDHPHEGVILYDTGCGKDYPEVWGPIVADVFARVDYEPEKHDLEKAVVRAGYTLEQVKKVIISHLHVDHAGGLDVFMERKDVEVWVHELELKTAFWSVATGADVGTYLGHYLKLDLSVRTFGDTVCSPRREQKQCCPTWMLMWMLMLMCCRNWKTFDDSVLDFCQGITIHHTPGHTEGKQWQHDCYHRQLSRNSDRPSKPPDKHARDWHLHLHKRSLSCFRERKFKFIRFPRLCRKDFSSSLQNKGIRPELSAWNVDLTSTLHE